MEQAFPRRYQPHPFRRRRRRRQHPLVGEKKEFSNKTKMSEHVLEMAPRFLVASTFSR